MSLVYQGPELREVYSLSQSTYHPNLRFVAKAPCAEWQPVVRLPHDSDLPAVFGVYPEVAACLVYAADFWLPDLLHIATIVESSA